MKINKKYLFLCIGIILTPTTYAADGGDVIKSSSPNQYDCTVDELELFIMKRTENLRKESNLSTWQDYKEVAQKAKLNGGGTTAEQAANSPSNGNAQSEAVAQAKAKAKAKSGSAKGEEEDDCPLFFEGLSDIEDSELPTMDEIGDMISGGLASLQKLAEEQMKQLSESLMNVLKAGMCERLSKDYLTKLGTKLLDSKLKEEIGYTTKDISKGNFANKVINDSLKDQYGTSNAKLLNVMDEDLNKKRENFMKRQMDGKLNSMEKDMFK